jgi:hypothetical protein
LILLRARHPIKAIAIGSLIITMVFPRPLTVAEGPAHLLIDPEEALKRAAANEEKARQAEQQYFYRQHILVQTFSEFGNVTRRLHRLSEFSYDDLGNRVEKILEYPSSSLAVFLGVLQPNFKSLLGVDPFFLTQDSLARHVTKFVERQKVDDLNTLIFQLEPRDAKKPSPENRPFQGRVWIDEQDLMMVKCEGKAFATKDEKERFLKFEYYRENVERGLWLPSFAHAKDMLDMGRFELPIQMDIKYTQYKLIKPRR